MEENRQVLTLYDVRGIQDYVYRTSKMKDAIGASHIIEDLFENALNAAVKKLHLKADLIWCNDNGANQFDADPNYDLKVLYIGGGNACVIYKDRDTAVEASRIMAEYTMDETYSLQLAVAIVDKTDNYSNDYRELMQEMVRVKDCMIVSKPMDALPVLKTEIKTGFPLTSNDSSTESSLKAAACDTVRRKLKLDEKQFDSYVSQKGESSMLAVVHIDGNNMGLRIRELISGKEDYAEAVNEIRRISYTINDTYKKVLDDMISRFEEIRKNASEKNRQDFSKFWIMKVVEAGDDITYVCNASIAFATVEYFCSNISKYSMKMGTPDEYKYRFSACAGISYFNSHFPFNIAYDVAEECCESAKDRAKEKIYRSGDADLVGNWVDFQFCRSVHARNLDRVRAEEYVAASGENLLRRPYYIYSEELSENSERFKEMKDEMISYTRFCDDMKKYVLKDSNIPRSFVKDMRNTYPLGEDQMEILKAFLKSREKKGADENKREYPDEFYFTAADGKKTAVLYDALEVADYFRSFEDLAYDNTGKKEEAKA